MTWIKICGITNLEDALTAVEAGADAVGFVFYEKSPRNIHPDAAREIVTKLPSEIGKVGVFVEGLNEHTVEIFNQVRLTALQFHLPNDLVAAACGEIAYEAECFWQFPEIYVSVPATWATSSFQLDIQMTDVSASNNDRASADASSKGRSPFRAFFLDSSIPERPGGTGTAFDWEKTATMIEGIRKQVNIVVAGGLNPANVKDAISILHPWGVDVSSGVEAAPGKKDPAKVRAFVAAVRATESTLG